MSYTVKLKRSAEKELDSLPLKTQDKIIEYLIALKEHPIPAGAKKLQGREGYRIRVGEYRVLYTINKHNAFIEIFSIGHRKDVYKV